MNVQQLLQRELNHFDQLPLECDGMTNCIAFYLTHNHPDISFQVCNGRVQDTVTQKEIPLHYWIELDDNGRTLYVDYRLRMWLGRNDSGIPHGVFEPSSRISYNGRQNRSYRSITRSVYNALTTDWSKLI